MQKSSISLLLLLSTLQAHGFRGDLAQQMFQEIREHEQKMHALFEQAFSHKTSAVQPYFEIKEEGNALQLIINNVTLKGEKPDALLNLNEDKKQLNIEVTLAEGKALFTYTQAHSMLSTRLHLETTENNQRSCQAIRHNQHVPYKLDWTKIPTITYEKESKKLIVALTTEDISKQKGTVIPIEVK